MPRVSRRWLVLGAVTLLAVACRVAGLGDRLSADEGYSWLVASAPGVDAFFDRLAAYENSPPLLYALLAPLPLDSDEAWLRVPPLVAGVLTVPALWAAVRALLGERAAGLAALGLAVAPYHVSFSNYSRGFTLAALGVTLCLWAAACLAAGGRRRWWWLWAGGVALAVYSQYNAVLFVLPLLAALLATRARPPREVAGLGLVPFLMLIPWLPGIVRSSEAQDVTKVAPVYSADPVDALTPLFFGEHGVKAGALQLLLVVLALAGAAWLVRSRGPALTLLGGTLAGATLVSLLVALVGPDVFAPRYLTALIPLAAGLLAGGVAALPWRPAVPAAAGALVLLGLAVIAQRTGRELEPDYPRVAAAPRPARTLTNSAVVLYYLDLPPRSLDRPFGLGPGRERRARPPYAVVDDTAVAGGARPGPGRTTQIDRIAVRLVR
jgi:4-amino-4-deoxy-L-arabinose transferase-like glycosyltransferase